MARNLPAVECLLACGADPINESPMPIVDCLRYSGYAIDLAVCMLMSEIVELLIRFGASVSAKDDYERPALYFIGDTIDPFRLWLYHGNSVSSAVTKTVEVLLRNGANLNEEAFDEVSPLT
jgi:hypothetical protein